eukprot:CAMPEP_0185854890 /NCGR_PEP_ID=MMETSP1354-20130828/23871_1 /TAXON_ID=708628 /ORGANISM="Erythrolobus madagascarensis, Strain CCMP3276" /LENGTH=102 /DNA_ID=CAMNT_0028556763 /DNA_START=86 /DNA_END=390 /DNA_ORIENTATION=+
MAAVEVAVALMINSGDGAPTDALALYSAFGIRTVLQCENSGVQLRECGTLGDSIAPFSDESKYDVLDRNTELPAFSDTQWKWGFYYIGSAYLLKSRIDSDAG